MMYGWYDWGVAGWTLMALVMVLFWGGLIALVVWLVRRASAGSGAQLRPAHQDAEQLLGERFARGEIDDEEFESRRAALRRN